MKTKIIKISFILAIITILANATSALVVTSPVELTETNLLTLSNGQNKELTYYVQLSGNEGNKLDIQIEDPANIISLVGQSSLIITPGNPTPITFNLNYPENAIVSQQYEIAIIFKTTGDSSQTVGVGTSIRRTFNVQLQGAQGVMEQELNNNPSSYFSQKNITLTILIFVTIIILAIFTYYINKAIKSMRQ